MNRKRADKLTRREHKASRAAAASPPMATIIRKLLLEWCERLDQQDCRAIGAADDGYEFALDYHLMGAALLVKQVASECDEMELLGLASKIEMRLTDRFEKESEAHAAYQQQQWEEIARQDPVRERCRLYFKDPSFRVDVSRYHELIDAARIEDRKALYELYKYLDETKVLKRIKSEVTSNFVYLRGKKPDEIALDDLKREFDRELRDFYRRADKTVAARIDKALRDEGRNDPVAPRLPAPNFFVPQDADDEEA